VVEEEESNDLMINKTYTIKEVGLMRGESTSRKRNVSIMALLLHTK